MISRLLRTKLSYKDHMDIQNLILYVFDVVMLVAFARMLLVSNTVKIETKVGNKMKWMIPVLFLAIAMIGFIRYEGVFRIVQFIVPIILGVMYYFMKSMVIKRCLY